MLLSLWLCIHLGAQFQPEKHPIFDVRRDNPLMKSEIDRFLDSNSSRDRRAAAKAWRPHSRVRMDPIWNTPSLMMGLRALSAPSERPSRDIIDDFIRANTEIIQCDDWKTKTRIKSERTLKGNLKSFLFEQILQGRPLFGHHLKIVLGSHGEVLNFSSRLLCEIAAAPVLPRHLNRARALHANLVYFAMSPNQARVAYELKSDTLGISDLRLRLLDADSEELLWEETMTIHASSEGSLPYQYHVLARSESANQSPLGLAFQPFDSPTPFSPGTSSPQSFQPPHISSEAVTIAQLSNNASPLGWVDSAIHETVGNNVNALYDIDADSLADLPRPLAIDYIFNPAPQFPSDPATNLQSAIIQAFYVANWFHDRSWDFGFTEEFGNFQSDNFGRGGVSGDRMLISVQAETFSAQNGAFYIPSEDGQHSQIVLGMFSGATPARDSAFDTQILLHELTHGMTNRIHDLTILSGHARGMGEGWSDFFALSLLAKPNDDPFSNYPFGSYSALGFRDSAFDDNYYFGIRRYPYSVNLRVNPMTYAYIDPHQCATVTDWTVPVNPVAIPCSTASHAVGVLWNSFLWDIRAKFMNRYGFRGNEMMIELVMLAMSLDPPQPELVDGRDSLLLADSVLHDSQHYCDIWRSFAKRGLGVDAVAPEYETRAVVESFRVPDICNHSGGAQVDRALSQLIQDSLSLDR